MTEWTTACPDWIARFKAGRSLLPCAPLYPDQAKSGMDVFRSVLVVDVLHPQGLVDDDGRPVPPRLELVCREWALELAEVIFGAYDAETGEQRIREVFLKVPKKNWKSGWAGAVMLTLMVRNWRASNEGAIIAPTKDTADNVFTVMRDAIRADPELDTLFHIQPQQRTIKHRVTGMTCRVYAADTDTVSGKKWAFVIFEEVWLLAQRAGAKDMIVEATGGQASRLEGIVISITTESDEEPVGIYKEKLEYARQVRDGKIHAPHFLPILYEWPEDMLKAKAYLDPKNFHLVNPNYGASVDPVDMLAKFDQAKAAGGESLRLFLAKRLNVPPGETVGGSWAGSDFWQDGAEDGLTLAEVIRRSEVLTVGIDGGGLDDLFGLAVIGREIETGNWLHSVHAWCHPIALERRKSEAPRYGDFQKAGELTIVDKVGDDVEQAVAMVLQCEKSEKLDRIGLDVAGITAVVDALKAAGIGEERLVAVPQNWKLSKAIRDLERGLAEGTFFHAGTSLMNWCVGNARVEPRGNAIVITKQNAGVGKIDPLAATFNAAALMALNPEPRVKNYEIHFLGGTNR